METAKKNEKEESWYGKGYSFFSNTACEYYPCHAVGEGAEFNCLFCYCPLYALGRECGGNFTYLDNGVKSCENCLIPHTRKGYGYVMEHFSKIVALMKNR